MQGWGQFINLGVLILLLLIFNGCACILACLTASLTQNLTVSAAAAPATRL